MYGYEPDYDERSESEYERDVAESNEDRTVTVLPKATVTRVDGEGVTRVLALQAIHLDSNENMDGATLHELHAMDSMTGRFLYWFETTDSLKALLDDSVCPFANLAGQAYMQRESDRALARLKVALGNS